MTNTLSTQSPHANSPAISMHFDVFKLAGNGDLVLIEAEPSLRAAMARVMALREIFPGNYMVVSRATGRRISFTADGAIKRT